MPMEYANAEKFLKSYNRIESQLKILYGGRATQNFTDLVKRCSDRNITVRLIDDAGNPGPEWLIINAWPCRYSIPDFNALSAEVAVESVEFAHEGLTRVSSGEDAGTASEV